MGYRRALKLKLLTVGHDIDETGADSIKSLLDRGFHLKEHEEVLLEMILNRGEQDEENDPFDPYLMALEESQRDDSTVVSQSMEELDNRLMDFALDHDWDDCNSMNDMSTLKYSSVHKRIPGLAQLSRRLRLSESNHSSAPTAQGMSTQGRSHRLSAISEEVSLVGSASGCCTFPASGSTANGGTSRSRSQAGDGKGSKQQVDYLRQMRDRRDLEQLCATLLQGFPLLPVMQVLSGVLEHTFGGSHLLAIGNKYTQQVVVSKKGYCIAIDNIDDHTSLLQCLFRI